MPYNLVLDQNPSFSPTTNNDPVVSDWVFDPAAPIDITYTIGASNPATVTIAAIIKDYLAVNPDYNYYIKQRVGSNSVSGLPTVLSLSGDIDDTTNPNGYLLTSANLNVDVIVSFINMQLLEEGSFSTTLFFDIYRQGSNGIVQIYGFKSFVFNFNILAGSTFQIIPTDVTLVYVHGVGTLAPQTLNIEATGNFTLAVQSYITLTGGNLIDQGLVNNGYARQYTGSGSQSFLIDANSDLEDLEAGYYTSLLKYNNGVLFKTVNIQTVVFETDEAQINPSSFEFSAIKGFTEAEAQNLTVVSPYPITLQLPVWLTSGVTEGDYSIEASIVPILSENLSAGVYEDNIIVTANGVDYLVPVMHTVYETVFLGINPDEINYTDDYNTITRFFQSQDYKIDFGLSINHYKHNSETAILKELSYKLALFNNTTEFFVGRTLNNIMAELDDLDSINFNNFEASLPQDYISFFRQYYKPAEINLQVDFIHQTDELLNGSLEFSNLLFIKGRKPLKSFPNTAILNYYAEPIRVTPSSLALFNFYKTENHELLIYKNGELLRTIPHAVGNHSLFMYRHKFKSDTPGDVIEIRLYRNSNEEQDEAFYSNEDNYISQKYIVFPYGKQSYHIAWEDEYDCLSLLEFTGDITFKMGYENNTVNNYKEFREYLRKIDSRRSQSVSINTGFLLSNNPKELDSLLNAKRAWIMSHNSEPVALVPSTEELTNYDSDQELYAFDVEFQINLNNDNKVNS